MCVCVYSSAVRSRERGAAPSHLELSPDVAVFRMLNYTDHQWDFFFLDFFICQGHSWVIRYIDQSCHPPLSTRMGKRFKNHSGTPWNGMLDISSQVFQAAALSPSICCLFLFLILACYCAISQLKHFPPAPIYELNIIIFLILKTSR